MRTLLLSLLISFAAFAQCGPNGQLVTIGGNKVCRPKSTLLDCPGGTCAIGTTLPEGAPAGSLAVDGELYSALDMPATEFTAYYTMEEGSGTTLVDHSGNNNDGTMTGTVTWSGGGITFGSDYHNYVALPTAITTGSGLRTILLALSYNPIAAADGFCAYTSPLGPISGNANVTPIFNVIGCHPYAGIYTKATSIDLMGYGIHVLGYVLDPDTAGNNKLYIDGIEVTQYNSQVVAAISAELLSLGSWYGHGTMFPGTIYSAAFARTKLTDAQMRRASETMLRQIQRRGVNTSPQNTTAGNVLWHVGDSLTVGSGSSPTTSYVKEMTLTGTWTKYNMGLSGATLAKLRPIVSGLRYSEGGGTQVVVLWGGTNSSADGAATMWADYSALAQLARKRGFKVLMTTMIDRQNNAAPYNVKAAFNTLIRANWQDYADALVDVAADANLGADGASTNLTYFNADQVHLNNTGYALAADIFEAKINALSGVTASGSSCTITAITAGKITAATCAP